MKHAGIEMHYYEVMRCVHVICIHVCLRIMWHHTGDKYAFLHFI